MSHVKQACLKKMRTNNETKICNLFSISDDTDIYFFSMAKETQKPKYSADVPESLLTPDKVKT